MGRPKNIQPKDKKIQWWVTLKEEEYLKECLAAYRAEHKPPKVPIKPQPQILSPSSDLMDGTKPVQTEGRTPEEFLASLGLKMPEIPENLGNNDSEVDYSQWRTDSNMLEIDRGMCYEIDDCGYPDIAEKFAARHQTLFVKAHQLKQTKRYAEFDRVMHDEIWPIVQKEF